MSKGATSKEDGTTSRRQWDLREDDGKEGSSTSSAAEAVTQKTLEIGKGRTENEPALTVTRTPDQLPVVIPWKRFS